MKKGLFILLYITLSTNFAIAAERWAIVVGISNYPVQSGWRAINGAKDIGLIVPMLELNDFAQEKITTLSDEQATKKNIKQSIEALCLKLAEGDIVYFHFSGHGQLITDIDGDEVDENGIQRGYDQSFIPYDAQIKYNANGYRGENHIVDDELNVWFSQIKNKIGTSGKLLVVLDACHSGNGSRGETDDEIVCRGVKDPFVIPSNADIATTITNKTNRKIDWVCISACKWVETSEEYQGNGRLSVAISRVLKPSLTKKQLKEALVEEYKTMSSRLPQSVEVETGKSEFYIVL
jgi:hypothetical protein